MFLNTDFKIGIIVDKVPGLSEETKQGIFVKKKERQRDQE